MTSPRTRHPTPVGKRATTRRTNLQADFKKLAAVGLGRQTPLRLCDEMRKRLKHINGFESTHEETYEMVTAVRLCFVTAVRLCFVVLWFTARYAGDASCAVDGSVG